MDQGSEFEAKAAMHLKKCGYKILAQNWHSPFGEIDIIASDPVGTLVFVEVRHRIGGSHGGAAGSVDRAKQKKIILTAKSYLSEIGREVDCRFDVIVFEGQELDHLKGAFELDS